MDRTLKRTALGWVPVEDILWAGSPEYSQACRDYWTCKSKDWIESMGAPIGNQNAAKGRQWTEAINRAWERLATGAPAPTDVSPLMRGLDMAADRFVAKVMGTAPMETGESPLGYFKELGDRQDGKAVQPAEFSGPNGGPIPYAEAIKLAPLV